jgi:hypothetical protein
MFGVIEIQRKWIGKHVGRLFERHTMLLDIGTFLPLVPLELHGFATSPGLNDFSNRSDVIVLNRPRQQPRRLGIGRPVRDRQLADEAEHLGHVLALRPVVGDLGLEVVEADLGVVPIRGLVDGEEDVAQQGRAKALGAPLAALEIDGICSAGLPSAVL